MDKKYYRGYEIIQSIENGTIKEGALIVDKTLSVICEVKDHGLIWKPGEYTVKDFCSYQVFEIIYPDKEIEKMNTTMLSLDNYEIVDEIFKIEGKISEIIDVVNKLNKKEK